VSSKEFCRLGWRRAQRHGVRMLLALFVVCGSTRAGEDPVAIPYDPAQTIIDAALGDTYAYDRLGELCDQIGPRLAGTERMRAAIAWAVQTLQQAGFDSVWTEPVRLPLWERGEEWARVTSPEPFDLTLLGLGNSVGTPPGGIEAALLVVESFEELESRAAEAAGRIVLFNPTWRGYGETVRYRGGGASAAARHGAVACLVRSVTDASLATPHTGMMTYADSLPKIPTAAITVEDAGRLQRLARRGAQPRVRLSMGARTLPEVESFNVVAEIRGREKPEDIVLAAGHLDSWDTGTGAHDDGAGCLITMGAARLLLQMGLRPRRTLRIVWYEAEEFGGIGGRAYFQAHRDELDRYVAALESDSGAFPPRGFSVQADSTIVQRLQTMARPLANLEAAEVQPGWSGVDIRPLVQAGVPGIGHRTRADDYFHYHHSPADTFDKIDPEALARNVAAVATLLYAIAEADAPLRPIGSATAAPGSHE
jgi:carboxypeptidase Q